MHNKENYKRYYYKNRANILARRKQTRLNNLEQYLAKEAHQHKKHRLKQNERGRLYALKYPERIKAAQHKFRAKHRKRLSKQVAARAMVRLATPGERIKYLAQLACIRAKKMGRAYERDFAQFYIDNPPVTCACCAIELDYARGKGKNRNNGPSLDRVDNTKGYVRGNVSIICKHCNTIKRDHSVKSLGQILQYIQKHFQLAEVA